MKRDIQVGIRMPSKLRKELTRLADAEHRSLASYIVLVFEKHVESRHQGMVAHSLAGIACLALSACAAAPALPPLPDEPPSVSRVHAKPVGEQVAAAYNYCIIAAAHGCPDAITVRCEAYRPAFVKSCLLSKNVPADYIAALTR